MHAKYWQIQYFWFDVFKISPNLQRYFPVDLGLNPGDSSRLFIDVKNILFSAGYNCKLLPLSRQLPAIIQSLRRSTENWVHQCPKIGNLYHNWTSIKGDIATVNFSPDSIINTANCRLHSVRELHYTEHQFLGNQGSSVCKHIEIGDRFRTGLTSL